MSRALIERGEAGDLTDAARELVAASHETKDHHAPTTKATLMLGEALERLDQLEPALDAYLAARPGERGFSAAMIKAGDLIAGRGVEPTRAALDALAEEAEHSPDERAAVAWVQAQAAAVANRTGEALDYFEHARASGSDALGLRSAAEIARLELSRGDAEKAEEVLSAALAKRSPHGKEKARLTTLSTEIALARADYRRAYERVEQLDPHDASVETLRAEALIGIGRPEEAITLLRAIDIGPEVDTAIRAQTLRLRALAEIAVADDRVAANASRTIEEVSTTDPSSTASLAVQAAALLRNGDVDGARARFGLLGRGDVTFLRPLAAYRALDVYVRVQHLYSLATPTDLGPKKEARAALADLPDVDALPDTCRPGALRLIAELADALGDARDDAVARYRDAAIAYTSRGEWMPGAELLKRAWELSNRAIVDDLGWDLSEASLLASYDVVGDESRSPEAGKKIMDLLDQALRAWDERFSVAPPDSAWAYVSRGRVQMERAGRSRDEHNRALAWESVGLLAAGVLLQSVDESPLLADYYALLSETLELVDATFTSLWAAERSSAMQPDSQLGVLRAAYAYRYLGFEDLGLAAVNHFEELAGTPGALDDCRAALALINDRAEDALQIAAPHTNADPPEAAFIGVERDAFLALGKVSEAQERAQAALDTADVSDIHGDATLASLYILNDRQLVATVNAYLSAGRLNLLDYLKYLGLAHLRRGDTEPGRESLDCFQRVATPMSAAAAARSEIKALLHEEGLRDDAREVLEEFGRVAGPLADAAERRRSPLDELRALAEVDRQLPAAARYWSEVAAVWLRMLVGREPGHRDELWDGICQLTDLWDAIGGTEISAALADAIWSEAVPRELEALLHDAAVLDRRTDDQLAALLAAVANHLPGSVIAWAYGIVSWRRWRRRQTDATATSLRRAFDVDDEDHSGLHFALSSEAATIAERLAFADWLLDAKLDRDQAALARTGVLAGLTINLGLAEAPPPTTPGLRLFLGTNLIPPDTSDNAWPLLRDLLPEMDKEVRELTGVALPGIEVTPGSEANRYDFVLFGETRVSGTISFDNEDSPDPLEEVVHRIGRVLCSDAAQFALIEDVALPSERTNTDPSLRSARRRFGVARELALDRVPLQPFGAIQDALDSRPLEEPLDDGVRAARAAVRQRLPGAAEAKVVYIPRELDEACRDLAESGLIHTDRLGFDSTQATVNALHELVKGNDRIVLVTEHAGARRLLQQLYGLVRDDVFVIAADERIA